MSSTKIESNILEASSIASTSSSLSTCQTNRSTTSNSNLNILSRPKRSSHFKKFDMIPADFLKHLENVSDESDDEEFIPTEKKSKKSNKNLDNESDELSDDDESDDESDEDDDESDEDDDDSDSSNVSSDEKVCNDKSNNLNKKKKKQQSDLNLKTKRIKNEKADIGAEKINESIDETKKTAKKKQPNKIKNEKKDEKNQLKQKKQQKKTPNKKRKKTNINSNFDSDEETKKLINSFRVSAQLMNSVNKKKSKVNNRQQNVKNKNSNQKNEVSSLIVDKPKINPGPIIKCLKQNLQNSSNKDEKIEYPIYVVSHHNENDHDNEEAGQNKYSIPTKDKWLPIVDKSSPWLCCLCHNGPYEVPDLGSLFGPYRIPINNNLDDDYDEIQLG
jgi:hypothetical protein